MEKIFFVVFIRFRHWNLFLHCIWSRAPVSWYSNAAVRSDVYAARWRKTVRCETVCKNQCHTVMLLIVKCRSAPWVGDNGKNVSRINLQDVGNIIKPKESTTCFLRRHQEWKCGAWSSLMKLLHFNAKPPSTPFNAKDLSIGHWP